MKIVWKIIKDWLVENAAQEGYTYCIHSGRMSRTTAEDKVMYNRN